MTTTTTTHDATFYVQIEPEWRNSETLRLIKAVALTQSKPGKPRSGTVTVKLTIRIPDGAFLPLRPEAIVVIPEGLVTVNPIEVTAEEPDYADEH